MHLFMLGVEIESSRTAALHSPLAHFHILLNWRNCLKMEQYRIEQWSNLTTQRASRSVPPRATLGIASSFSEKYLSQEVPLEYRSCDWCRCCFIYNVNLFDIKTLSTSHIIKSNSRCSHFCRSVLVWWIPN